jgi:hypothetical protein
MIPDYIELIIVLLLKMTLFEPGPGYFELFTVSS